MQRALVGGDSEKLTIVCPLNTVQAPLVVQRDDGIHLLQVREIVDLDATLEN